MKNLIKKVLKEETNKILSEVSVPDNVRSYAKSRGILSLVTKIVKWVEKSGQRIRGGTAIGKYYNTLLLDITHHGGEIRINVDTEDIKVNDKIVTNYKEFKEALEQQD